eukprot:TRINITY_DN18260_c0_g1_i1.p1 TRINITY_DN18260_c0_g1~~TRINITY_DN18260_c0_g1_i1.p1  ORF type:complete len:218 (-),score=47.92 TRINITY_DN18260_c0_g1_i1:785-1438(-)
MLRSLVGSEMCIRDSVALRKTLDVGLSLAEQEQINLEAKQSHQIESILMFIVDSLQRADYRIEDDLLVEAGDTPLWVGLLENPTNCTVVASKKGAEPSSVLVTATYPTGTFFGDMEILQSVLTPNARPNRTTSLHIEECTSPSTTTHEYHMLSDSIGRNSSFIAGTPTTTSITLPIKQIWLVEWKVVETLQHGCLAVICMFVFLPHTLLQGGSVTTS